MDLDEIKNGPKMDDARNEKQSEEKAVDIKKDEEAQVNGVSEAGPSAEKKSAEGQAKEGSKEKKGKCKKDHKHKKDKSRKKSKKAAKDDSSDEDSTETEATDTPSESESEDSEEEEEERRRKKKKKAKRKAQKKKSKKAKSKRYESSSEESEESEESDDESEDESDRRKKRKSKKSRRLETESEIETEEDNEEAEEDGTAAQNAALQQYLQQMRLQQAQVARNGLQVSRRQTIDRLALQEALNKQKQKAKKKKGRKKDKKPRKGSTLEYKRVDNCWDSNIRNYALKESAEDQLDEFDEYLFTVRRNFNWENKYRDTVVDIKSKLLRDALAEVMKDVRCVSLVEDQPCLDPNILFLYLEDLRTYYKKTLKARVKKEKKSKARRKIKETIKHCRVLVGYLDEDYEDTKKRLYPMLEAGNITFDLLWALFKPNTIAVTSTYGAWDEPRCFKVDYANKENSFIRGDWYCIEGRYLEYDGKNFGLGDFEIDVDHFQGPRRITSLATYPLQYHREKDTVKKTMIERGKRFVELAGMKYRFHKGLAFHKKRKTVLKFNTNGRIMIDPAIFRRIIPNYPISFIKPKDQDDPFQEDDDDSSCGCNHSDSDDPYSARRRNDDDAKERPMTRFKVVFDEDQEPHVVEVPVDEDGNEVPQEKLEKVGKDNKDGEPTKEHEFTEEELLIASPVVLGFAFSEKQWLEFTLSGVTDIQWNDEAFDSLVIPQGRKDVVKALVSSHKFHPAQTIDDVVQGKGKGLVFLLHGPPGVGKTLTGEGIAEYLKCPLYAVGAGDLGTDSRQLEGELQRIMDIAHSWGAVLLLDEADVFLEKRQHQDVHRNALVSIFLRLLEYFQGILFLTTNRVADFDEAFQSRIHISLKYEELSFRGRREIWKRFLDKARVVEGLETSTFKEDDYDALARKELNGRQIKNTVRVAQASAVHEEKSLRMEHIRRVLETVESFDRDLKGGPGYEEALRAYT